MARFDLSDEEWVAIEPLLPNLGASHPKVMARLRLFTTVM